MKKVQKFGDGEAFAAGKKINGNYYVVVAYPARLRRYKFGQLVIVYHAPDGGSIPDTDYRISQKFDKVVRSEEFTANKEHLPSLEEQISQAVNEAVCKVEDQQEYEEDTLQRVEAALEANKEVHEGIDYQLR